jgi:hypothetical protein
MDERSRLPNSGSCAVQSDLAPLRRLANRHFRWMLYAGIFGVLSALSALVSRSALFAGIAVIFGFFTWNKWHEWRRARRWTAGPLPQSESEWTLWLRIIRHEAKHPPLLEKASNWIAYSLAAGCFIVVSLEVLTTTTSLLTRVGWAGAYLCAALVVAAHLSLRRQQRREDEGRKEMLHVIWRDLT